VEVTDAATTRLGGGWIASSTARRLNYTSRKSSGGVNEFGSLSIRAMNVDKDGREVPGVEADVDAVVGALGGRSHAGRRASRCRRPTGNQREGWPSADMPCSAAYATSFDGARSI
jgi:hypothetical protein